MHLLGKMGETAFRKVGRGDPSATGAGRKVARRVGLSGAVGSYLMLVRQGPDGPTFGRVGRRGPSATGGGREVARGADVSCKEAFLQFWPRRRRRLAGRRSSLIRGIGQKLAGLRLEDGDEGAERDVPAVFRLLFGGECTKAVSLGQVIHSGLQLWIGLQREQPAS